MRQLISDAFRDGELPTVLKVREKGLDGMGGDGLNPLLWATFGRSGWC